MFHPHIYTAVSENLEAGHHLISHMWGVCPSKNIAEQITPTRPMRPFGGRAWGFTSTLLVRGGGFHLEGGTGGCRSSWSYYRRHIRENFEAFADETDPQRVEQLIQRAQKDADWVVAKVSPAGGLQLC